MKEKIDQAYGVIPYAETVAGDFEFFLIYQYSPWRNDVHWGFPKGHSEVNESPEQTALRELQEETQLLINALNNLVTFDIYYEFVHEDTLIKKTVSYFLAEAASRAYTIDDHEVREAGWFPYQKALDQLTHEQTKDMLKSVHEYLRLVD